MKTSQPLVNRNILTPEACLMCCDIKNSGTTMESYEYINLPINIIPEGIITPYNLRDMEKF